MDFIHTDQFVNDGNIITSKELLDWSHIFIFLSTILIVLPIIIRKAKKDCCGNCTDDDDDYNGNDDDYCRNRYDTGSSYVYTDYPTSHPTSAPSKLPTHVPTAEPTFAPTVDPSLDDQIVVSIYGSKLDDKGLAVLVDNNENIYTTGFINKNNQSSAFLRQSNAEIEEIFTDILYDPLKSSVGYALYVDYFDSSDNTKVYVAGEYGGDILLMKYSLTSSKKSKTPEYVLNNFGPGASYAITADDIGQYLYITGSSGGSIFLKKISSSDGAEIFSKTCGIGSGYGITFLNSEVYMTGALLSISNDNDIFFSKYNNNGKEIFTKISATPFEDVGTAITVDNQGYVYLVGYTEGELDDQVNKEMKDSFLMKYTSQGDKLFTRLHGYQYDDISKAIYYSSFENKIYVTGSTRGPLHKYGNDDMFLLSYTTDGKELDYFEKGVSGEDSGQGIYAFNNQIYIQGYSTFNSQHEKFDGQHGIGGTDLSLIKYSSIQTHTKSVVPGYLIAIIVLYIVGSICTSLLIFKGDGINRSRYQARESSMSSLKGKKVMIAVFVLSAAADFITDSLFVKQVYDVIGKTTFDERNINNSFYIVSLTFLVVPIVYNMILFVLVGKPLFFLNGLLKIVPHVWMPTDENQNLGAFGVVLGLLEMGLGDVPAYIFSIVFYPTSLWFYWDWNRDRFNAIYGVDSEMANLQAIFFFLYPCCFALSLTCFTVAYFLWTAAAAIASVLSLLFAAAVTSILVPITIVTNLFLYFMAFSNSELTYIFFGQPGYYFIMTCSGVWIEDIPQFLIQLAYSIMMIQFNHKVSVVQIASFTFTFWHFGYATALKYIKNDENPPSIVQTISEKAIEVSANIIQV